MKKIFFILCVLVFSGCQTTKIERNSNYKFKIGENNVKIISGKFLQSYNDILSGNIPKKK